MSINIQSPASEQKTVFFEIVVHLFFLSPNLLTLGLKLWNVCVVISHSELSFRHIEILLCDVNKNVAYVDACERVPHARLLSPEHITMRLASARYMYRLCSAFRTIERRTTFDVFPIETSKNRHRVTRAEYAREKRRSKLCDNYENYVIGERIVGTPNGCCTVIMRNVNARMINGEHLLTVRAAVNNSGI